MTGLVNALYQYARGNQTRIDAITAERDALAEALLDGDGKASVTVNSGTINGKTFAGLVAMSREQRLDTLTDVLVLLGEIADDTAGATTTYGLFGNIQR